MKHSRILILTIALGFTLQSARAVDPLPAELENATLAKQAEYWKRTSEESGRLKAQVAKQRYEKALAYKQSLHTQMEDHLAQVQAQIQAGPSGPGGTALQEEPVSWGLYGMMAALLGGGFVFVTRQMQQSERLA